MMNRWPRTHERTNARDAVKRLPAAENDHDMTSMTEIHLGFLDRLRVLFGATLYLRTHVWFVKYEPPFDAPSPLVARSESDAWALTPWVLWWRERHSAMGAGHTP